MKTRIIRAQCSSETFNSSWARSTSSSVMPYIDEAETGRVDGMKECGPWRQSEDVDIRFCSVQQTCPSVVVYVSANFPVSHK